MISFIGNRPALQIGNLQILDYDTSWLEDALRRAASAANLDDFPLIPEIKNGIEIYLEHKCSLRLMRLEELFDKMRLMLMKMGCETIANQLQPLAPPITYSLVDAAKTAGNGFELAFFCILKTEIDTLRKAGAEKIEFFGLRESTQILRGASKWNLQSEILHREIHAFLQAYHS